MFQHLHNLEECWVMTGSRGKWFWKAKYDHYSVGLPASVAFDYNRVLEIEDAHKAGNGPPLLGWAHTHPHWLATPSSTDDATMHAWTDCLGRDLLCCIHGTDGWRAWWYMKNQSAPKEVSIMRFSKNFFGRNP